MLAVDQFMQYALETQTLTLHPAELFDPEVYPQEFAQSIAVHELAHQWFGDSVAIAEYSDLWLAEGPATWYEHEFNADFYRRGLRGGHARPVLVLAAVPRRRSARSPAPRTAATR